MKGLLIKDFCQMARNCRSFLIIIVVFSACMAFSDSAFFAGYPLILAGILPVTLISYDEREKWNVYAKTLPVSAAAGVSAKYIVGLVCVAAAGALVVTAQLTIAAPASFFSVLVGAAAGLAAPAMLLPFVFKFGSEKGRVLYYVVIIIACIAATAAPSVGSEAGQTIETAAIALAGAALIYAVSWLISIKLYANAEK